MILKASGEIINTDSPRNVITFEPIDLIWKAHLSYEHVLNNKLSIGVGIHYYYHAFPYQDPEFKADIFFRYYYSSISYIQAMGSGGQSLAFNGKSVGGSFSWGVKRIFPKSHITIDASLGLQIYSFNFPNDAFGALQWYSIGPGAILIPRIALGYAF